MRLLPITTLFVLLAPVSFATVTVTVIENPSQTATLTPHTAKSTHISHVATSHQTKATVVPSSSTSAYTTPTSVIQATHIQSGYPSAAASHGVDVAGAAGGSDSDSFSLSKGGLIAIVVVVVVVAVFGVASVILYVLAKRRQWNVRASIKRASRRLTGRRDTAPASDRRKRSGVIAGSTKPNVKAAHPAEHKRGVAVEVKDVEKGPLEPQAAKDAEKEDSWKQRLLGNSWRRL